MRKRAGLRPLLVVLGWAVVLGLFVAEAVVFAEQRAAQAPRPAAQPATRAAGHQRTQTPTQIPTPKPKQHPSLPATASPSTPKTRANPFAGTTVGIDPGHNGRNYTDPTYLNRRIFNGRTQESCNTTGTETAAGYPEARFAFAVATYLAGYLRAKGAKIVMTRTSNGGVGPCVDERARIINEARADVAIDIHGNGEPAGVRGFSLLVPVPDGRNDAVVDPSRPYAELLRTAFARTGMPVQGSGIVPRSDLAGLNLTTVPQVLIECGNMRSATDASLMTSPAFQQAAAKAIRSAMATFLRSR